MKKSHYINGMYFDVTTEKTYPPPQRCALCGTRYGLTYHHYLSQNKCTRALESKKVRFPKDWDLEFITANQKLIPLCLGCHSDVYNLSDGRFLERHGVERNKFIYKD